MQRRRDPELRHPGSIRVGPGVRVSDRDCRQVLALTWFTAPSVGDPSYCGVAPTLCNLREDEDGIYNVASTDAVADPYVDVTLSTGDIAPNGVSVAPGIPVDFNDCLKGSGKVCPIAPDGADTANEQDNLVGAYVKDITLAAGSKSNMVVYRITGIPDCRNLQTLPICVANPTAIVLAPDGSGRKFLERVPPVAGPDQEATDGRRRDGTADLADVLCAGAELHVRGVLRPHRAGCLFPRLLRDSRSTWATSSAPSSAAAVIRPRRARTSLGHHDDGLGALPGRERVGGVGLVPDVDAPRRRRAGSSTCWSIRPVRTRRRAPVRAGRCIRTISNSTQAVSSRAACSLANAVPYGADVYALLLRSLYDDLGLALDSTARTYVERMATLMDTTPFPRLGRQHIGRELVQWRRQADEVHRGCVRQEERCRPGVPGVLTSQLTGFRVELGSGRSCECRSANRVGELKARVEVDLPRAERSLLAFDSVGRFQSRRLGRHDQRRPGAVARLQRG